MAATNVSKGCPYHTGMEAGQEDLCRRCDEFKTNEGKVWETLDEIKTNCQAARENCQKGIAAEMKTKLSTGTIAAIAGITVTILCIVGALYSSGTRQRIEALEKADTAILSVIKEQNATNAEQRKVMTDKLDDVHESISRINVIMARMAERAGISTHTGPSPKIGGKSE